MANSSTVWVFGSFLMIVCLYSMQPYGMLDAQAADAVREMSSSELKAFMQNDPSPRAVLFITSNCAACKKAISILKGIYEAQSPRMRLIAVSVNPGGPEEIQPAIDRLQVPFPVYWTKEKAIYDYRIFGVPVLFLIKEGDIQGRIIGPQPEAYFREKLSLLFDE